MWRLDRALPVQRTTKRVHHAADQGFPTRHAEQPPGRADFLGLLDAQVIAQHHRTDGVLFEVEHHAGGPAGELEHLARHGLVQPVDAGHAVADLEHLADLGDVELGLVAGDLLFDDRGYLVCLEFHGQLPVFTFQFPVFRHPPSASCGRRRVRNNSGLATLNLLLRLPGHGPRVRGVARERP